MALRRWSMLCVIAAMVASVEGQTLPPPANTAMYFSLDIPTNAARELTGLGIPLPGGLSSTPWKDDRGNQLVWRQTRNDTDVRGGRHVFYRQYLINGTTEAEVFGSEVGLHYATSGNLSSIAGRQFKAVAPTNLIAFGAVEAVTRVLTQLQRHVTFRPETPQAAADQLPWRIANTRLKVVSMGDTFRYAWFTFARTAQGVEHQIVMDAETEELLSIGELHLRSNCQPTTPWQMVGATGYPVRPDLFNAGTRRTLQANYAFDRPAPYAYEAYDSTGIHTTVVQETGTTAFKCDPNPSVRAYTLVPVTNDAGIIYRDDGEWHGNAAGDALYHSLKPLAAFTTLGRSGWDGHNGDANVVLDSTFADNGTDYAYFRMTGGGDPRVPPTPFLGIARSQNFYNPAAALDVVAHEWGHGVIFTSANFPCIQAATVGCQLHEGFADVIGMIVEKMTQPVGGGVEQSDDWTMHEDNGTGGYERGAVDDGNGHNWLRLNGTAVFINHTVHRQDEEAIQEPHYRGNMLSVVLRLLTEGGSNPGCSRNPAPAWDGCSAVVTAQFDKGRQIMFDTVQYYAPSTATWADLATYATDAAFDLYSDCAAFPGKPALGVQNAVNEAFTAIGYPRLTPARTCN